MEIKVYRLKKGDKLKEFLNSLNYSGMILSVAGCIEDARIRLADGKTILDIFEKHEIVSLTGTLSKDGAHIHISIADNSGKVIGGHLISASVGVTCELVVGKLKEYSFSREFDETTGYKELKINDEKK